MRTRVPDIVVVAVVVAAAAACRQPPEGTPPAPSATASATAPGASPSGAPGDSSNAATASPSAAVAAGPRDAGADGGIDPLCAAILAAEKLDERATQLEDRTSPGPRLLCASTGKFAWALRVDPPAPHSTTIRQTILFSSAEGAHARLESKVDGVEWPPVLGRHTGMFDFDNDGVPELYGQVPANIRTYEPASRILVTFKKGVISPYPISLPPGYVVDRVVDVDGDGRPDLKVAFVVGKRTACQPGEEGDLKIELVAHGLKDGTFTLDDPMTWNAAKRTCKAMPAPDAMFVTSMPPSPPDPRDLSMSHVSCSRLRGKPTAALVSELEAACAGKVDPSKKCGGACRHLADALAVAKFNPPMRTLDDSTAGVVPIK